MEVVELGVVGGVGIEGAPGIPIPRPTWLSMRARTSNWRRSLLRPQRHSDSTGNTQAPSCMVVLAHGRRPANMGLAFQHRLETKSLCTRLIS